MSDETLAREIESALAVDPSPEFVARVRTRVAAERVREPWIPARPLAWVGAGALLLSAVAMTWRASGTPSVEESHVSSRVESPAAVSEGKALARTPEVIVSGRSPDDRPEPAMLPAAPVEPLSPPAWPEVVISQEEAAALQRLFDAIATRRMDPSVLPDLPDLNVPPMPLEPIEVIVVEPITLSPLARLDSE